MRITQWFSSISLNNAIIESTSRKCHWFALHYTFLVPHSPRLVPQACLSCSRQLETLGTTRRVFMIFIIVTISTHMFWIQEPGHESITISFTSIFCTNYQTNVHEGFKKRSYWIRVWQYSTILHELCKVVFLLLQEQKGLKRMPKYF